MPYATSSEETAAFTMATTPRHQAADRAYCLGSAGAFAIWSLQRLSPRLSQTGGSKVSVKAMNSLPSLSGSDVSFGTLFDDRTIHETVINFTCLGRKLECVGFYEGLRIARLTEEQTLVSKVEQAGIKHLTTNCSSAEELIKQYPAVESNEGQSLVTFLTTLLAVHENNEILKGRFHYSGPKSPPYHFDVSNALPLTVSLNSVGSSDLVIRLRLLVGDSELFSDLVRLSWVKLIGLLNAGHLSLMRPGEPPHQREHPRRTVVTTRCVRLGLGNPSSEATGLIVRNYRASIKTLYEKVREADKAAERSRKAFLKIKNGHDGHLLDNITDAIVLKGVSKAFAKLSGNVSAVLREDRSFREKDPYLEIMVNPLEYSPSDKEPRVRIDLDPIQRGFDSLGL